MRIRPPSPRPESNLMKHQALCIGGLLLLPHHEAAAANITWANSGKTFSSGLNWVGGTAPADDLVTDNAIFGGTPSSGFQPNLTANRSVGKLSFGSAGWDFTANAGVTLGLGTGGILSNVATAGSVNTMSAPLSLAGARTFEVAGSSTHALHLDGVASGAGGITKTGIGVLVLNANNTYTGATTVNAGTLRLGDHLQINIGSDLVMGAGGTFDLAGSQESVASISGSGSITLGAGGSLSFGWDDTSTTWSGTVTGNSAATLFKYGTGQLTLNGTVDFGASPGGGTLFINEGSVELGSSNRISNGAAVSIATGSTLLMGGFTDFIGPLTGSGLVSLGGGRLVTTYAADATFNGDIAGPGSFEKFGAGVLTLGSGALIEGSLSGTTIFEGTIVGNHSTFGSNATIQSGAALRMEQEAAGTFAGSLSGPGDFIKNGAGSLSLSGASSSFTGDIELNAGDLTLGSGSLLSASVDITTTAGTTLTTSNHARTVNSLSGSGNVNLNGGTLTLKAGTTFNGIISGTGSGLTFDPVNGTAALTLGGANTYTGTTLVNNGTLRLAASNVISNSSPLTVQTGATFDLDGFSDAVGLISGGGDFLLGGGTLTTNVPSGTSTFNGTIQEAGNFTKSGTGTLVLGSLQSYTGNTVINTGILRLGIANALPAGTALNVTSGDTFDLNGFNQTINSLEGAATSVVNLGTGSLTLGGGGGGYNTTFSGVIQGTGGLKVQGINGGTLVLAGANDYTGETLITGGVFARTTLRLADNYRLDNSTSLRLGLTGDFDLNGYSQEVANLEGGGRVYLGEGGELYFGANNVATTFSGEIIGNVFGSPKINKTGTGTFTMTGSASSDFDTELSSGAGGQIILDATSNNALSDTGRLTLRSPAAPGEKNIVTLALGRHETVGPLTVEQFGEIVVTTGNFTTQSSEDSLVTGVIKGGGDLAKFGSGTLEFTLDNSSHGLQTLGMDIVAEGRMKGTLNNMPGDIVVLPGAELHFRQNYNGSVQGREYRNGGMIRFDTGAPGTNYSLGATWTNFYGTIQLSNGAFANNHVSGGTGYTNLQLADSTLSLGLNVAGSGSETFNLDHITYMDVGKIIGNGFFNISHESGSLRAGYTNEDFTFHGRLTGLGSFSKRGTGTMTLTNSASDLAGGYGIDAGGTLRSGANEVINGRLLSVSGTFDLNGYTETLTSLVSGGQITLGGGLLKVEQGQSSAVVSEAGSFSKTSAGELLFTGQFLQTGNLSVFGGTLTLDGATTSGQSGFYAAGAGTVTRFRNATNMAADLAELADEVEVQISDASSSTLQGLRLAGSETLVEEESLLDVTGGTFVISDHNIIRIRDSEVNLGSLTYTSGSLEIDMQGGAVSWGGDLTVDQNGWFGAQMVVSAGEKITLTGNTTIAELSSLTLDGGIFSTGSMTRLGALVLNRGIIEFTGNSGISVGGSSLANGLQIPYGVEMRVPNGSLAVTGAANSLYLTGGTVMTRYFDNEGVVDLDTGVFEVTNANETQTNASNSGTLLVGNTAAVSGVMSNSGRITLRNDSGYLRVGNVLDNTGLIHGAGRVRAPGGIQNTSTGEIRGENGRLLTLESAAINLARISLQGGTLEFAGGLENGLVNSLTSPVISGRGTLITSGITNRASMAFSSGNTDIYGDVNNVTGGRIVTSGGAAGVTTFFDDVIHNGTEIRTSAGSSTVFFGSLAGSGPFTGPGTVYVEGDMRPGNSAGMMNFGGDLVLSSTSHLVFEIGGTQRGSGHDAALVSGDFSMGGTLEVVFIPGFEPAAGSEFDLFDWSATSGGFSEILLPDLDEGLEWDTSRFETEGILAVEATTMNYERWMEGIAFASGADALATADPDRDGMSNLLEYALGTNPLVADSDHPSAPRLIIVDHNGSSYLGMTYQRPSTATDRRGDLIERVTRSTNPGGTWSTDEVILHDSSDDGTIETRVHRSTLPMGTLDREFLRFEVETEP